MLRGSSKIAPAAESGSTSAAAAVGEAAEGEEPSPTAGTAGFLTAVPPDASDSASIKSGADMSRYPPCYALTPNAHVLSEALRIPITALGAKGTTTIPDEYVMDNAFGGALAFIDAADIASGRCGIGTPALDLLIRGICACYEGSRFGYRTIIVMPSESVAGAPSADEEDTDAPSCFAHAAWVRVFATLKANSIAVVFVKEADLPAFGSWILDHRYKEVPLLRSKISVDDWGSVFDGNYGALETLNPDVLEHLSVDFRQKFAELDLISLGDTGFERSGDPATMFGTFTLPDPVLGRPARIVRRDEVVVRKFLNDAGAAFKTVLSTTPERFLSTTLKYSEMESAEQAEYLQMEVREQEELYHSVTEFLTMLEDDSDDAFEGKEDEEEEAQAEEGAGAAKRERALLSFAEFAVVLQRCALDEGVKKSGLGSDRGDAVLKCLKDAPLPGDFGSDEKIETLGMLAAFLGDFLEHVEFGAHFEWTDWSNKIGPVVRCATEEKYKLIGEFIRKGVGEWTSKRN